MKKEEIDESKINFDIYNGLNLYSPCLGEQYAKFQWNPLGENFVLDISFIERYLENAKSDNELSMPPFMENEPEKVLESFRLASKRNKEMLDELQNNFDSDQYKDFKDANIEKQVEEMIIVLKCRQKMLEISIGQLKSKTIDAFTAYKNIKGLNKKLSQLLDDAYTEEWNKKIAIQNMLLWAQNRAKDFGDLYTIKPFVFDKNAHMENIKTGNFLDNIISSVKDIANAFSGNMSLNQMPDFKDYVDTFQNIPQQPTNENTQNSNVQQNSGGNTFNM